MRKPFGCVEDGDHDHVDRHRCQHLNFNFVSLDVLKLLQLALIMDHLLKSIMMQLGRSVCLILCDPSGDGQLVVNMRKKCVFCSVTGLGEYIFPSVM